MSIFNNIFAAIFGSNDDVQNDFDFQQMNDQMMLDETNRMNDQMMLDETNRMNDQMMMEETARMSDPFQTPGVDMAVDELHWGIDHGLGFLHDCFDSFADSFDSCTDSSDFDSMFSMSDDSSWDSGGFDCGSDMF